MELRKFSLSLTKGTRTPKPQVIMGAESTRITNSNGTTFTRRLPENNLNGGRALSEELSKVREEKKELSRGLNGGNLMSKTYTLKRFSNVPNTPKVYRLKRKTFTGVLGAVGDGLKYAGGKVAEGIGNIADNKLVRTGTTIAGIAKGFAMGGLPGALLGGVAANLGTRALAAGAHTIGDDLQT